MTKRIASFDLARGVGIVLMVTGHVFIEFTTDEFKSKNSSVCMWIFSGYLGAPVFHFLMGASLGTSSRCIDPSQAVRRGIKLLLLGYALNALSDFLPTLVLLKMGLTTLEEVDSPLDVLLQSDTLQVGGVAFMMLGFLQSFSQQMQIVIALFVATVTYWLCDIYTGNLVIDRSLSIFYHISDNVTDMALCPFLSYSIFGMVFGSHLKLAVAEKRRTAFENSAKFGLSLIVATLMLRLLGPDLLVEEQVYARNGTVGVVWLTGLTLCWLWALEYHLVVWIPKVAIRRLGFWSRNITCFYCIHWLVIEWVYLFARTANIRPLLEQGPLGIVITSMSVLTLTDHLTSLWATKFVQPSFATK